MPNGGVYAGYQTSEICLVNGNPVYVLYNGDYFKPEDLLALGYWGWSEKVCSILPFDYWP